MVNDRHETAGKQREPTADFREPLLAWQQDSEAMMSAALRSGSITLKGNSIDIMGNELSVGDTAPEFQLQDNALADVTLASESGKTRIIATIPSLDTPVCHAETKRFNDKVSGTDIVVYTVSMDLPFGQKRWCGAEGVENVKTLSAHRCTKFGEDYGVLIKGGALDRCLCRAIFVVDGDNKIKHVEYVGEIAEHPDYDAAFGAARS